MTADEIRRRTKELVEGATSTHKCERAAVELLGEIAAQLADVNFAYAFSQTRSSKQEQLQRHTNPEDCPSVRCGLWKECQGHPNA